MDFLESPHTRTKWQRSVYGTKFYFRPEAQAIGAKWKALISLPDSAAFEEWKSRRKGFVVAYQGVRAAVFVINTEAMKHRVSRRPMRTATGTIRIKSVKIEKPEILSGGDSKSECSQGYSVRLLANLVCGK